MQQTTVTQGRGAGERSFSTHIDACRQAPRHRPSSVSAALIITTDTLA